jgi:hypothetical protein
MIQLPPHVTPTEVPDITGAFTEHGDTWYAGYRYGRSTVEIDDRPALNVVYLLAMWDAGMLAGIVAVLVS